MEKITDSNLCQVIEEMAKPTLRGEVEVLYEETKTEYEFLMNAIVPNHPTAKSQYIVGNRVGRLSILGEKMRRLEGILARHPKESET